MTWEIITGDCLEVMRGMEDGSVDAVVTDPPYGIGEHGGACRTRGKPGYSKHKDMGWDNETPAAEVFSEMLSLSVPTVVWGGNYFSDKLPPSMGWLYWRKKMGGDFSDGELAWTSERMALREFTMCPKGMDKKHPCQKPVPLLAWCLDRIKAPLGSTILDPFCGSGTTGVACIRTGRNFLGIEISEEYANIARRRCEEAERQGDLFVKQPKPKADQLKLT